MNHIRRYREKAGLSQAQLSMKCGFPGGQGRISNYETGERNPSIADAQTIAGVLGCSIDDLYPPKKRRGGKK